MAEGMPACLLKVEEKARKAKSQRVARVCEGAAITRIKGSNTGGVECVLVAQGMVADFRGGDLMEERNGKPLKEQGGD